MAPPERNFAPLEQRPSFSTACIMHIWVKEGEAEAFLAPGFAPGIAEIIFI